MKISLGKGVGKNVTGLLTCNDTLQTGGGFQRRGRIDEPPPWRAFLSILFSRVGKEYGLRSMTNPVIRRAGRGSGPYGGGVSADHNLRDDVGIVPYRDKAGSEKNMA